MNTQYTQSEREYWIAKTAACTSIVGNDRARKVVPNVATVIKKATERKEEPPQYAVLKRWWDGLPDSEQLRLHETYAGNYLFIETEAAEDCLKNAVNLAKAASPTLIEELVGVVLSQSEETKDRIAAAKVVFQVAGALTNQPSVVVNVDARKQAAEEEFIARWEKTQGTSFIVESDSVPANPEPSGLLVERLDWMDDK